MGVYSGEVPEEGNLKDAQELTSLGEGRALKNAAEGKWLVKTMNGKDLRREKEQVIVAPRGGTISVHPAILLMGPCPGELGRRGLAGSDPEIQLSE